MNFAVRSLFTVNLLAVNSNLIKGSKMVAIFTNTLVNILTKSLLVVGLLQLVKFLEQKEEF